MEIDIAYAYRQLKANEISSEKFKETLQLYVSQRLPKSNNFDAKSIEATLQRIHAGIKDLENDPDLSEHDIASYVDSSINTAILKPFSQQRYKPRLTTI